MIISEPILNQWAAIVAILLFLFIVGWSLWNVISWFLVTLRSRVPYRTNLGRYEIHYQPNKDRVELTVRPDMNSTESYTWWCPTHDYLIFASDVSRIARRVAEDIEEMRV